MHVDLTRNENPFLDALYDPGQLCSLMEQWRLERYPDDAHQALRCAIAERHCVDPGQVLLGAGSSEVLLMAAGATTVGQGAVVSSTLSFPLFAVLARHKARAHREVPSVHFGHDVDALICAGQEPGAVIFVDNPCNPTGTLLIPEQIARLAAGISPDALLVIDEAYIEYAQVEGAQSADFLIREHANLIVVRSMSKAFGLAGIRVGYALAHEVLIDRMHRHRLPFNINGLSAAIALHALSREKEMRLACHALVDERRRLEKALCAIDALAVPSRAGFVMLKPNKAGKAVSERLAARGVLIKTLASWGWRISVGRQIDNDLVITEIEDLARGIAAAGRTDTY